MFRLPHTRMKNSIRRLHAEQLEERRLLSSDSGAFFGFGSLTASIAPDDTRIGFRKSELHSAFDAKFGANQWQPAIERAIQTWVREAELNIGWVADSGTAAGVYGPSQGDARFGDIRIFGYSLGDEVWAEAVSENARGAGTWAGDIIFNVDADWQSLRDLEMVTIHELGHVLGLKHSEDPNSPMFSHGPSAKLTPTAEDIVNLHALHGPRAADPTEGDKGNDSPDEAYRIRGNEEDEDTTNDDFNGSQIWLQFGDLLNASDVDVFEIHVDDAYSGPLAVSVRTKGLSLAKVQFELVDGDENVLATSSFTSAFGGQAMVQVDQVVAGQKYYVRVSKAGTDFWAQGDYALAVGTPRSLTDEQVELAYWGDIVHRWYFDSRGAKRGFSYHLQASGNDGYSDDDGNTDDVHTQAGDLTLALTSNTRTVYMAVGTVSDQVDVDYYKLRTPKSVAPGTKLLINLESLELNGLVPRISVFDDKNRSLDMEFLSVGYGATQLLIHNVRADSQLLVRVDSTGLSAAHRAGNYTLNLELSAGLKSNEIFASGKVVGNAIPIEQTLYLAIPQVITFSLESATVSSGAPNAITQANFQLFNSQQQLIHNIVAPLGTMRSLPGVFLDAGEYYLQISAVTNGPSLPVTDLKLTGTRPTDPIGVLIADVDSEPIYECDTGGDFCFPDGAQSPIPSHVGPGPVGQLPRPLPAPVPPPPDDFFWVNDLIFSTNPSDVNDTNNDGMISPLDVLLVINFLNANASGSYPTQFSGYIDTNADKIISPIDALSVINVLNS